MRRPPAIPAPPEPLPVRAPVGATPSTQRQLSRQRRRPVLVRLYAALASDVGVLGAADPTALASASPSAP